ncbi:MAG: EAL domain-containing protein [Rhodocyclaceae bacterium]|nr:EAL domain-containing protein [Rhodocyclaceae bacterium]MBX3669087.1 EAL domain-containing protein [Rhodocyclaceae bacterium]
MPIIDTLPALPNPAGPAAASLRILLVEDVECDAELARLELERRNIAADWLRVWTEADFLAALAQFRPDVILSDLAMPGLDGWRVLELARSEAPDLPFIFLSGTLNEADAIEALKGGAVDYIFKSRPDRLAPALVRAVAEAEGRRARRAAERARRQLAEILEVTPDFVWICDREQRLRYANAAGLALLGLEFEQLGGLPVHLHYPAWAHEVLTKTAFPTARAAGAWHGELALLAADGEEVPVSQVLIAHRDDAGVVEYYSGIARDLRERRAYETRIASLSNYDPLTRLPNRTLLEDRTTQALARAHRNGSEPALVIADIDRFSRANEVYGRTFGDALLCEVARRLRGGLRRADTVARLAGDCFAVLLAECRQPEDARMVAEQLRAAVCQPYLIEGRSYQATASLGVAAFPRDGSDFPALLRNADAAMHRAKSEHHGIAFYDAAMTRLAQERLALEQELQCALERDELRLHYQPQIDIASGRVAGWEALVRWQHPVKGMVPPLTFIPVAEETGLIRPLGVWVLRRACRDAARWPQAWGASTRVAVNLSVRQLHDAQLVEQIAGVLAETGLDPARLELEITESDLMQEAADTIDLLLRIKALGVQISIDDFGTGYSSLAYLSRFPIDRLKIDRSFVQRMSRGAHDGQIVRAIIALAHGLSLAVIAEGVENAEQLALLAAQGCGEAQGYLIAAPMPEDRMTAFMAAYRPPAIAADGC